MGIVNVTPDSFSDGGDHADAASAIAYGVQLASEGASIIDVGGESTRPGAQPVDEATELARVIPATRWATACGCRSTRRSRPWRSPRARPAPHW
jgi:dihydropteroate synthase